VICSHCNRDFWLRVLVLDDGSLDARLTRNDDVSSMDL
jgi:hypothetical protein